MPTTKPIPPDLPATRPGSGRCLSALACLVAAWAASGAGAGGQPGPDRSARSASPAHAIHSPSTLADLHSLIDEEGRPFAFARFAKTTVLANFIFTSCPMKCPTQTQALVAVQRSLPPALRTRVRFVSITVDPARDSAAALKRYAVAMGADLASWSFVTGEASELDWLYRFFSVGVNAIADGQYDHQMGAYLLDGQGRVMQRYTGDIDKPRLLKEIGAVDALGR